MRTISHWQKCGNCASHKRYEGGRDMGHTCEVHTTTMQNQDDCVCEKWRLLRISICDKPKVCVNNSGDDVVVRCERPKGHRGKHRSVSTEWFGGEEVFEWRRGVAERRSRR